jgi:hypothetical protein
VSNSPPERPEKSNAWLIALIVAAVLIPAVCVCGGVTTVLLYRLAAEPGAEPPAAEEVAPMPPPPPPPAPPVAPPKLKPGPLAPDKPD